MRTLTRRLSIRWRITIGSVLIGALLLAVAAIVFHAQIGQVLLSADKKLLYDATTSYMTEIQGHPEQIDPPGGEQHLAVVRPDGSVPVNNLPDSLTAQLDQLVGMGSGSHLVTAGGHEYLIVVRTVPTSDGDWHVVASHDQRFAKTVLGNLTNILFLAASILLVALGLTSWLLTTAALRPVSRMRAKAESLVETGSVEELPVGEADDEIADLAITLNSLLRNVRTSAAREKQMVADASHELRTPIAVLRGQLELAQSSIGDPAAHRRDLTAARDTSERLSRLATNLLQLSTLEANQDSTVTTVRALIEEFRSASDRARLLAPDKNIDIDFDTDVDVDGNLDIDYRISDVRFGQVLDNLLGNAVRATPSDGRIHVELRMIDTALQLTVQDSGPGVPAEFAATAFDRFTRARTRRGTDETGSGLGLAIAAAIIANASGTIRLDNSPGGGLQVLVTIPEHGNA